MIPRSTAENELAVAALAERLAALPIGGEVTYEDLDAAAGINVREDRYLLARAIRRVNERFGALIQNVHGIGYKRIPIEEGHCLGVEGRRGIRRRARRIQKTLTNAITKANDLQPAVQRKLNAELSALGLIEHISKDRIVAAAEAEADKTKPQSVADTAKSFLREIGALPGQDQRAA